MTTTEPDQDYDPFEDFNRSAGIGVVEDPYPMFALARAEAPLIREDELDGSAPETDPSAATAEDAPEFVDLSDIPDVFTAFSFDAVQAVLRDGELFSSKGYEELMGQVMGHTILEMDEPEHHTYRALAQQAFSRKAMQRWESDVVTPIVDAHIDDFVESGRAELVSELLFPFPVSVIAGMLGLPRTDLPQFHRWAVELISVGFDMERGLRASAALADYFSRIIAERRDEPRSDVISVLAHADLDGQHLTDDEIIAFLRLLLPAGAETTYRSSANLLFGLLSRPDQLDALRADRTLMAQAIEEGLRWEPPLLTILRTATRDTVVEGIEIPAQSVVVANLGSANRDEHHWDDADAFDLFRDPRQHLAFAFGPHMCLGIHLARMETSVVVNRLLDRLPELRFDPDADAAFITGMIFRAPNALAVVWD